MRKLHRWFVLLAVVLTGIMSGCGEKKRSADPLHRGLYHLRSGNYAVAREHLLKAAQVHTNNPSVYCNLGVACWKLGENGFAVESLLKASELAPADLTPRKLMAWVFIGMENWDAASDALAVITTPDAETLTLRSTIELHDGNLSSANSLLQQAIGLDPDYPAALYNLALLNRDELFDTRQALEFFARFRRVADGEPRALQSSEEFMNPEGGVKKAIAVPISQDPAAARITQEARDAVAKGQYDAALFLLKDAAVRFPDDPNTLWELAALYEQHIGNTERARKLFAEFADRFPRDPRTQRASERAGEGATPGGPARFLTAKEHIAAGSALYEQKKWQEAAENYKRAFQMDRNAYTAAYNLGLCYRRLGDNDRASEALKAAIRLNGDLLDARYLLSLTQRQRGHADLAVAQLQEIVKIDPAYAKAHYLMGGIRADQKHVDSANAHFKRYLELVPTGTSATQARQYLQQSQSARQTGR